MIWTFIFLLWGQVDKGDFSAAECPHFVVDPQGQHAATNVILFNNVFVGEHIELNLRQRPEPVPDPIRVVEPEKRHRLPVH